MRWWLFVASMLFGSSAFAAETVYATAEVASQRFLDADTAGPTFAKDARLEVLVREGDRVRVREGDSYGWVLASTVTSEAPEGASAGGFDMNAILEQLKAQGINAQAPQ
jgi:hypothetical protein